MHSNRPRIKVPLTTVDVVIEFITLAVLVCLWAYVIMKYQSLPEIVPTHFNAQGEVDGTGGKSSIWFLMGITTVITIGMYILTKFPHIHNYMTEITEENAPHNYKMSARLLRIVNLITLFIMGYVALSVIQAASGENSLMGNSFMYILIAFSVIMPIVLLIYIQKNQKAAKSKN
ncbi:DUF1648 domain-containing protein [Kordia zhangzhouensis]|uniref:DUF1648 domain-containing protein n=1 Tax=Kordia zhangzhouensis TaxID=1620405 RepID=UPI0006295D16|nr:DUF1648 domain-containing protein [Kordia zhangzhouensis]